jgi:hypothetical protein
MYNELKVFDMNTQAGRAALAEYEQQRVAKSSEGQQIYAKIKRSSKYYGQTDPGEIFPVRIATQFGDYAVQGGPGSQYRLSDVNLFIVDVDGEASRIS